MHIICDKCKSKKHVVEFLSDGLMLCLACLQQSIIEVPSIKYTEYLDAAISDLITNRTHEILKLHKIKSKSEKEVKEL